MPQHGSAVFGLFFASPDCIDYNGCRKAKKRVGRVKQLQTPIDEAAASSKYCRFGLGTLHSYARACLLAPVGEAYSGWFYHEDTSIAGERMSTGSVGPAKRGDELPRGQ
jgi:hypothetical protein